MTDDNKSKVQAESDLESKQSLDLESKMKIKLNKANFNEWYPDVIELANLSDKRYPVKGMNVWTPYGWKLMLNIDSEIRKLLDGTGHGEVCFPLLIPKTEFAKEADHIKGFDAQVYWVTHSGTTELDIPLLLRPTSETAMYPIFQLWVRSHNDLPLKTLGIKSASRILLPLQCSGVLPGLLCQRNPSFRKDLAHVPNSGCSSHRRFTSLWSRICRGQLAAVSWTFGRRRRG